LIALHIKEGLHFAVALLIKLYIVGTAKLINLGESTVSYHISLAFNIHYNILHIIYVIHIITFHAYKTYMSYMYTILGKHGTGNMAQMEK